MSKRILFLLAPLVPFVVAAPLLGGCVVHETVVEHPACAGGEWVPGHYGPGGYWYRGHWVCPRRVERVIVE